MLLGDAVADADVVDPDLVVNNVVAVDATDPDPVDITDPDPVDTSDSDFVQTDPDPVNPDPDGDDKDRRDVRPCCGAKRLLNDAFIGVTCLLSIPSSWVEALLSGVLLERIMDDDEDGVREEDSAAKRPLGTDMERFGVASWVSFIYTQMPRDATRSV